jgi:hypothetical protein
MSQPQLIGLTHESFCPFRCHPGAQRMQQNRAGPCVADDGADIHASGGFNNSTINNPCTECASGQFG